MDAVQQLLLLILAFLVFLAVTLRRTITRNAALPSPTPPTINVSDPAMARCMLIDHADAFSNRPIAPFPVDFAAGRRIRHSINSVPYGPLWRALRCNLTAGILHPSRLGLLAPLERETADALVANLLSAQGAAGEAVLLRDSLHTAVFTLVARLCFGDGVGARDVHAMQGAMREFFADLVDARALAASRMARLLHWRRWKRFGGTFDRFIGLFLPLIAARQQRRSRCGGDGGSVRPYVDSLLDLQVPDDDVDGTGRKGVDTRRCALTDHEMATLVWEFLGAGTETVVSCVEWTLAHIAAQPEVQVKLHREIAGEGVVSEESLRDLPYLRAVILESLRLHPPVPFIVRDVSAESAAVIGGATAAPPDDATVVRFTLMAGDFGRDRKAWTDPDEFRPERFLAGGEGEGVGLVPGPKEMRMMPFGAGRRYCPGVGLGMAHVRCLAAALVREFEWAPPVESGGVDLAEQDGFFKVMKTPLRARASCHAPNA